MKWFSDYTVNKTWLIGRVEITFSIREAKSFMGRFGGGWNWKLGIQVGGSTALISLLIAELTLSIKKGESCKSS